MNKFKKKSVALFATMMVAVAAAGYVYQQNQAEESLLSELAMANVEALAGGEVYPGIPCMMQPNNYCWYVFPDEIIEVEGILYQ